MRELCAACLVDRRRSLEVETSCCTCMHLRAGVLMCCPEWQGPCSRLSTSCPPPLLVIPHTPPSCLHTLWPHRRGWPTSTTLAPGEDPAFITVSLRNKRVYLVALSHPYVSTHGR